MHVRYDHRKLALQNNARWKKRRISASSNLKEAEITAEILKNERKFSDAYGGLLGMGKSNTMSSTKAFQKKHLRPLRTKKSIRRDTIHHTSNRMINSKYLHCEEDTDSENDLAHLGIRTMKHHYNHILENERNDDDNLQNIMVHLEEKQKKREKEKIGEDFQGIKARMAELLGEYSDPDEELDMQRLVDPEFFSSEDTKEKAQAQNNIDELMKRLLGVCQERDDILGNVFDALDFDELLRELKSPVSHDIDNVSSEISITIELINQSSAKLNKLYNRLVKLYTTRQDVEEDTIKTQQRELDLQKQVIGKFKMLRSQNVKRKEKVETWKYAANEIVDLLQSVRQKGATDFEQLEKEFKKLVQAFSSQSELVEDQQTTIEKLKFNMKKTEATKEKLKNDNALLQDEYDRSRVHLKTSQLKNEKLENDYKEACDKLSQIQNNAVKPHQEAIVEIVESSKPVDHELISRVEALEKKLLKAEQLLKKEQTKTKELIEKRHHCKDLTDVNVDSEKSFEQHYSVSNVSVELSEKEGSSMSPLPRRKCIKCNSYQQRILQLTDELNTKNTQILRLTKVLSEKDIKLQEQREKLEGLNSIHSVRRLTNTPILPPVDSQLDLASTLSEKREPELHSPTPTLVTSNKQIVVFQKISFQNADDEIPVAKIKMCDQSTQTVFSPEKQIEIVRQRSSLVPMQHVVAKNYSSIIEDDIKNMTTRIYGYINSVGEHDKEMTDSLTRNKKMDNEITEHLINKGKHLDQQESIENCDEQSASDGERRKSADSHHVRSTNKLAKTKLIDIHSAKFTATAHPINVVSFSPAINTQPISHGMFGINHHPTPNNNSNNKENKKSYETDNNNTSKSYNHHSNISKLSNMHPLEDESLAIERSANESGFFDEGSIRSQGLTNSNNVQNNWSKIRAGVVNHILRFLNCKAKNKCSHLQSKLQIMDLKDQSDVEIIQTQLNVFAEHAIDILDIISYSVKQMNERHVVPATIPEEGETMLSSLRSSWEPPVIVTPTDNRKVKIAHTEKKNENIFPDIPQHPRGSALTKKKKEGETMEVVKAKVAEKKRQKILDRHRKLVERLRASGVSLKQIYTILGIRGGGGEESSSLVQPKKHGNRKISLVGHGYGPDKADMLKNEHIGRKVNHGLSTVTGVQGTRGYSRRLSTVGMEIAAAAAAAAAATTTKTTEFPPLINKLPSTKPIVIGNFFQTRPLTGFYHN